MAERQAIDWSFFSMARYLLMADPARPVFSRPAGGYPRPTARVVALDELDAALPAGTARVTPAQRRGALDERLRQVTRLQRS